MTTTVREASTTRSTCAPCGSPTTWPSRRPLADAQRCNPDRRTRSAPDVVRVGHLQRLVQDRDTFPDLLSGGGARRHDVGPVEVDERPEPACFARCSEIGHRLGVSTTGIERNQWLAGYAVAYQLQRPEHTESPNLTDAGVAFGQCSQLGPDDVGPERASMLDDAFFAEDVDRGHCCGAGQGMTRVRQPAGEGAV